MIDLGEIKEQFVISEKIYLGFIDCFLDENPFHTDENFAQEKGFKSKVMHGNILNGFLSFMIGEKLPFKNVIIHKQSIKYHNPVYLLDEVECTLTQDAYIESVNTLVFSFAFNSNKKKIASGKIQIGII